MKKYLSFLYWYNKNPEVKLKYSTIISTKTNDSTINKIHNTLINNDITFTDDFEKSRTKLNFEIQESKLSYIIQIHQVDETKHKLYFETKYFPYYPFRKYKKLNEITTEYNQIYELISQPFNINYTDKIILVEMTTIDNNNSETKTFNKLKAEIVFKNNKIQVSNYQGTEHGDFLLYFIIKWITEYRIKK